MTPNPLIPPWKSGNLRGREMIKDRRLLHIYIDHFFKHLLSHLDFSLVMDSVVGAATSYWGTAYEHKICYMCTYCASHSNVCDIR